MLVFFSSIYTHGKTRISPVDQAAAELAPPGADCIPVCSAANSRRIYPLPADGASAALWHSFAIPPDACPANLAVLPGIERLNIYILLNCYVRGCNLHSNGFQR